MLKQCEHIAYFNEHYKEQFIHSSRKVNDYFANKTDSSLTEIQSVCKEHAFEIVYPPIECSLIKSLSNIFPETKHHCSLSSALKTNTLLRYLESLAAYSIVSGKHIIEADIELCYEHTVVSRVGDMWNTHTRLAKVYESLGSSPIRELPYAYKEGYLVAEERGSHLEELLIRNCPTPYECKPFNIRMNNAPTFDESCLPSGGLLAPYYFIFSCHLSLSY